MAPTYIYYRVYDANGIVDVKAPLPSEISNSKTIGRIMKSLIPPPFSVANVKLSIAQQEGYQGVFEARGAQLFTVSSQEQITEKNGLLKGAGLSMTSPLKLRFSGKLQRDMSAPFVGKWRHTKIGSNDTYRYKDSWQFTLRKAPGGKIAAAGYEYHITTYTDFVDSGKASEESLPSPDKTTYELSNFKVVSESSISFTRTRSSDGATWKVSGDLGADGKWLTLTLKRAGSGVAPTATPAEHHISVLRDSPHPEYYPSAADLYNRVQTSQQSLSSPPSPGADSASSQGGAGANHYPSSSGVPRLPPILQVEKQQVTTSATQLASATRRKNEAHFVCPVPGCGSTFTRRFNLRGHLRSHTEERPYVCEWPGCKKGFARQHDCKRHQALHSAKSQNNLCRGCKKTFSRLDALNRHLRSEGGAECRQYHQRTAPSTSILADDQRPADS